MSSDIRNGRSLAPLCNLSALTRDRRDLNLGFSSSGQWTGTRGKRLQPVQQHLGYHTKYNFAWAGK